MARGKNEICCSSLTSSVDEPESPKAMMIGFHLKMTTWGYAITLQWKNKWEKQRKKGKLKYHSFMTLWAQQAVTAEDNSFQMTEAEAQFFHWICKQSGDKSQGMTTIHRLMVMMTMPLIHIDDNRLYQSKAAFKRLYSWFYVVGKKWRVGVEHSGLTSCEI